MHMQEFITINEVCKMLGTTSRTIRYYEQCKRKKCCRLYDGTCQML